MIVFFVIMSNEKICLTNNSTSTSGKSRRIKIIKNLAYLMSLFDFLVHYILMVELGLFEQIYQTFRKSSKTNVTAIPLCKQYLSLNLSQMSLYIFYFSIIVLFISTEAMRKSSYQLYRFYIILKFIFALIFLLLSTIYIFLDRQMYIMPTSLVIPRENNFINITINTCLMYTREKLIAIILALVNVFLFYLSLECSKVFSFCKTKIIQV